MATKVSGSVEKIPLVERTSEEFVANVTRGLRDPKFTHPLIQDLNRENLAKFTTLCDLFTKYRPEDVRTLDQASVYASTLKQKNDAFSERQTKSLAPCSSEELDGEGQRVTAGFWDLTPEVLKTGIFVQRFQKLVDDLKPQSFTEGVLGVELRKLASLELSKTMISFQQELVDLHKIEAERYAAATELGLAVTTTARALNGLVPEIFRRTGRLYQTISYGGVPVSSFSFSNLTAYQIPLPQQKSTLLESEDMITPASSSSASSTASSSTDSSKKSSESASSPSSSTSLESSQG